jgi:putative phosphoribosyl transferase
MVMNQAVTQQPVTIRDGNAQLTGDLTLPPSAIGLVIFAHGSGSSRLSPRNRMVADVLVSNLCATLLFDLLTDEEAADRSNVFDIELLAQRLLMASKHMREEPRTQALPQAYFGASTGAAAALVAAAEAAQSEAHNAPVAVVSRGGRPDLAGDHLADVTCPTLLLVGSLDSQVLELNRHAQQRLRCESRLDIIDGATHLFEEPGTLEDVSRRAADWFTDAFQRQTQD